MGFNQKMKDTALSGVPNNPHRLGTASKQAQPPTSEKDVLCAVNNFATFASQKGLSRLVAGTNTSRRQAYEKMLSKGFRIDMLGVVMQHGIDVG